MNFINRILCRSVLGSATILWASITLTAGPATPQILSGHVPPKMAALQPINRFPPNQRLNLAVGLPLRNGGTLDALLRELYDPASPNFHQWLSVGQFTENFGPTRENYETVTDFLRAQGLTVTATFPNRMLINVAGAVADIEKAFKVNLRIYEHPEEARTFFAPDAEPSLDLAVPVLHINGLDDYQLPRPAGLKITPPQQQKGAPLAGSGPGGSYRGSDFRAAYASGVTLTGTGQFVGLLQFDGYYPSDITAYASLAGLTNLPLRNVLLDEVSGVPGPDNIEVALDIEMALSMAPGLAGVIVYEGANGNSILNRMAVDNVAKQLSASWTYPTDATSSQIFKQFAAQGQSYFNASGDSGAYTTFVSSPTDNAFITSVGGTTLTTRGPASFWVSEKTWSWFNAGTGNGASSGGISPNVPIPFWQQGIDMTANHGSTVRRNIPDVSMVSDNVFIIANNGTPQSVGGDSVACPLWAAFTALVNQQSAANYQPPIGFINPAIYAIGKGTNYAATFHDIKVGNNTNGISPLNFPATTGYDLCTGWGTPIGKPLINALAPPANARVVVGLAANLVLETSSPTNGTIDPGEVVMVNVSLQNIGLVSTVNLIATLQSNLNVQPVTSTQSYGAVVGGGALVVRSFIFAAHGTCGEPFNLTLSLQDGTNLLPNITFSLPLGAPLLALSQNFDTVNVPALPSGWNSAVIGVATNWITSSAFRFSSPNSVATKGTEDPGISELISPAIFISTPNAQLSFQNSYITEIDPTNSSNAFDGGLLEIKIGTKKFKDIIEAGGSFVSGGYTRTLDATTGNTLPGRPVWAGTLPGFVPTLINLPALAAGELVQFKWRLSTDTGNAGGATSWNMDNIVVKDGTSCTSPATNADLNLSQTVAPQPGLVGQALSYSCSITNFGPGPATSVNLTDILPPGVTFLFASAGCVYADGKVTATVPLLLNGARTNFNIFVVPIAEGLITNTIEITSGSSDSTVSNNFSSSVTPVVALPTILTQPTNQVVVVGADVSFSVVASGTGPLIYQWSFGGTNLVGANAPSLQLKNVQASQAGIYGVRITNFFGVVDSDVVTLKVAIPPVLTLSGFVVTSTNVAISLPSMAGINYTLEYKDSLADASWTPIFPFVPGDGNVIVLHDSSGFIAPSRFYRVNCNY
ncbi:MAG: protease pro-enzyme activation domain-containing protein [Verrucomicrobiota bacterium]